MDSSGPTVCPACEGQTFDPGFVDDKAQGRVRWIPGPLQIGLFGNAKGRTRAGALPVLAFRCRRCHRLELYADQAP